MDLESHTRELIQIKCPSFTCLSDVSIFLVRYVASIMILTLAILIYIFQFLCYDSLFIRFSHFGNSGNSMLVFSISSIGVKT